MSSKGFCLWIVIGLTVQVLGSENAQFFSVRPSDLEAKEGEDVEFQCHVTNRAGEVQWSKDGFLLGFDPRIPGYPRYSMDVREEEGVYNLRVKNVNLQDEGEFQCQVGPALNHTPIRAAAQLKILIPPEYISVNGLGQASTVEVKANSSVRLTCRAVGSKPPAVLHWFRDNKEVPKDFVQTEEKKDKTRFIATSYLTLRPLVGDDGTKFACEAFHKALKHRMRTEVTLSVLHAPGPPRIHGYQEGSSVQIGEQLTLVCQTDGGNPPPRLIWYRGNAQIDASYHLLETTTINNLSLVVSAEDNSAAYHCRASNDVTVDSLVASVKLNVFYLPSQLRIRGPTEAPVGGVVTLSCESDVSNPRPSLAWKVDGRELSDGETSQREAGHGFVATSNITITLNRQEPDTKVFTCSAKNRHVKGAVSATHKLTVIYSPRPPVIQGYESGTPLTVGDIQRFNCVCVGGNPPPMLRWFRGDREISTPVVTAGSGVSSELVFRVQSVDNGVIYRCEASNSALKEPLSAFVKLHVRFPPANVNITVNPTEPTEGDNVKLTCQSSISNPPSRLSWKRDGSPIPGQREELLGSSDGGSSSRSTIEFRATPQLHGTHFTCSARNGESKTPVETEIKLRIRHSPVFISSTRTVEVTEKHSTSINMTAHAWPEDISYTWSKDGSPLDNLRMRIAAIGAILEVRNASRNDSGLYQCVAKNEQGISKVNLTLVVLYGATVESLLITSPSGPLFEGSDLTLECRISASPVVQDMVTWRLRGGRQYQAVQATPTRSVLRIANVSRDLRGPVECRADNGIGGPSVMAIMLNVLYKPVVLQIVGEVDSKGSVRLKCEVEGTPDVTITWSLNAMLLHMRGDKYSLAVTSQREELRFSSVLIVRDVDPKDYGVYTCTATNRLGTDSADITLNEKGMSPSGLEKTTTAVDTNESHFRYGIYLRAWWMVAVGVAATLLLSCCLLFTCCIRRRTNRTTPERSTATRHIDLSPLSADDVCNKLLLSADVKSILLCAEKPHLPLHELKGHSVFTIEETYKIDKMRSRQLPTDSLESGLKDVFIEEILDKTKGDCPDILRNEKCLCLTTSKECVTPQSDSPESPRFNSTPSGSTGSCLSVYHEKTSIRSLGDADASALMKLHPIMVLRINEDAYKFAET